MKVILFRFLAVLFLFFCFTFLLVFFFFKKIFFLCSIFFLVLISEVLKLYFIYSYTFFITTREHIFLIPSLYQVKSFFPRFFQLKSYKMITATVFYGCIFYLKQNLMSYFFTLIFFRRFNQQMKETFESR